MLTTYLLNVKSTETVTQTRSDYNLSTANAIYVNEGLCPAQRKLYNAARKNTIDKHYAFLWIRGGKMLMKEQDGPVTEINQWAKSVFFKL